jgi:hypothetical protein
MSNFKVRVGSPVYSEKSIGVLVDVIIIPEKNHYSASRLEWFPKSLCEIEEKRIENKLTEYYLTAPEWLLKEKKVKYES